MDFAAFPMESMDLQPSPQVPSVPLWSSTATAACGAAATWRRPCAWAPAGWASDGRGLVVTETRGGTGTRGRDGLQVGDLNQYGYGSIPINTIFRGMNIHLPTIFRQKSGFTLW